MRGTVKRQNILLVKPEKNAPELQQSLGYLVKIAPLDLATVAALTPDDFHVDIWDEAVRGRITPKTRFSKAYDLVGVTGYRPDVQRTIELGRIFRDLSIPVVVGGAGVSLEPHLYRDHFDVLFIGEAEYTWPAFLADFRTGRYEKQYRQVMKVNMADSPLPRWDSVAGDFARFFTQGLVQTTRGCPFDCEYCDVISLLGRLPRHKSIEQVLKEIRALEKLGLTSVFIADDNFYGHPHYYKALLRELAALNATFKAPLSFFTQITVNIANDDEMLKLLADANVNSFLIGIESPNMDSLIETNKPQNYKLDLVAATRKIQSYGLTIDGSFIVGFDHDDVTIFDRHFEFAQEAFLPKVLVHTLKAPPETKLWFRLHKEGRVLEQPGLYDSTGARGRSPTNVLPKLMTLEELLSGYRGLLSRLHDWDHFESRVAGLIDNLKYFPPLMLHEKGFPFLKFLRFFVFNREGRRTLIGFLGDKQAQAVKHRLLSRLTDKSDRSRFLKKLVEDLVMHQHQIVTYVMPSVYQSVDEELLRLRTHGLPAREQAVFSVPDSFRNRYKTLFPDLYSRVNDGLIDKARTENALVEVVHDFLERWGRSFKTFEDHHHVQLMEICDRTVARENSQAEARDTRSKARPAGTSNAIFDGDTSDARLRNLSLEVLRCAEEELRNFGSRPAVLTAAQH